MRRTFLEAAGWFRVIAADATLFTGFFLTAWVAGHFVEIEQSHRRNGDDREHELGIAMVKTQSIWSCGAGERDVVAENVEVLRRRTFRDAFGTPAVRILEVLGMSEEADTRWQYRHSAKVDE